MNHKTFILFFAFFTLLLAGCQEKSSKKSSSSSTTNALNCAGQSYWTTPGCTGYCQYQPTSAGCTGSTTGGAAGGGTTGVTTGCAGAANNTTPGCMGFCSVNPSHVTCVGTGTTTGTSTSGSTGGVACSGQVTPNCSNYCKVYPTAYNCLPNGTNCNLTPAAAGCPGSSTPLVPAWGTHYPGGEPVGSCSEPFAVAGSAIANDTRKATLTGTGQASGSIEYNPLTAGNYLTTSASLKSVPQARILFEADQKLKLRIKVKPQPAAAQTATMCYGRQPGTTIPGYTNLRFNVNVYGVSANNSLTFLGSLGPYTAGVNTCTPAIDLSYYQQVSPTGVVVAIDQVQANQNCGFSPYNGFASCTSYRNVRSMDCWSMDFEIAADDTKSFN